MKSFLLICFLFFSFSSVGQAKLDIIGSLNYSDLYSGASGNGKLNHQFGINYNYKLKEKTWLRIGLGFTSMGYKDEIIQGLRFGSQHDGMGNFDPSLPAMYDELQKTHEHQFFEIPIALRREFSQKKLKPFAEVGISSMYYLQSVTKNFVNGDKTLTTKERVDDASQVRYAMIFAFGYNYNFNEKWEIIARPNFRYHFAEIVGAPVEWHLWSGGLALGMRMKLK